MTVHHDISQFNPIRDPEPRIGWDLPLGDTDPNNTSATALVSALLVAAGPCRLFGFSGFSNKGAAQFIQVFDTSTLPAAGAVPVFIMNVGASSNFAADWGTMGRWFDRGIAIANSSTAATLTAGSADTWFDCQWI